ncbi:MAG: RNA polymerase sigma factor [Bacteroidales bacterium]|nr:RNA polymerase sigma factor [Bacteroidales bacterium]MCM1414362.1 RNA polymerase sigma factor [bacterium]MCM1424926.1 RNA polymerase sigma factor [bacterium]
MSDDELIDRIKGGDEAAAKELIDRYYQAVLRYCGWHCAIPGRAEDLTQETFLKLFRSLPGYQGRNRFKAYLYKIANRLCIDESRKMPFYSLEDAESITGTADGIAQVEQREEVRRLFAVLSKEQRDAIFLRFGQELSFKEIAKVTGCSMRTAQSRVRGGLRLMKKEFGDER